MIPDRNPEIRERVRRLLFTFLRRVGPGVHAMATLVEHEDQAVRRAAVEAFAGSVPMISSGKIRLG